MPRVPECQPTQHTLDKGDQESPKDSGVHHVSEAIDEKISLPRRNGQNALQVIQKAFSVLKEIVKGKECEKEGKRKPDTPLRILDD